MDNLAALFVLIMIALLAPRFGPQVRAVSFPPAQQSGLKHSQPDANFRPPCVCMSDLQGNNERAKSVRRRRDSTGEKKSPRNSVFASREAHGKVGPDFEQLSSSPVSSEFHRPLNDISFHSLE